MSRNRSKWAISFVLVLAFYTSAYARERWTYLGDSHVDGSVDHDSIKVGRSDGGFRAIQLRVSDGAINFERVVVRFGNGTRKTSRYALTSRMAERRAPLIFRVTGE